MVSLQSLASTIHTIEGGGKELGAAFIECRFYYEPFYYGC